MILERMDGQSDEMLTLVDGKNHTTTWDYDQYGRVYLKVDATPTPVLAYYYDQNDRLTNRWSKAKGTTVYRYDPIGNLTNVDYSSGSNFTHALYYAYDGLNRLTNMQDGVGNSAFTWTEGDQLASEAGPWANDEVSYTYGDRLRSSISLVQPTAAPWIQGYSYDSAMRLSSVSSPAGGNFASPTGQFTYLYAGGGDRIQSIQLPATVATAALYITNEFDSLARLTNTYLESPLAGVVDEHAYAYDQGSEVTQQVFTAGNYINYGYDKIGQLKTASGMGPGGLTSRAFEQFGYAYDAAWNLNSRTNGGLIETFGVNAVNELTTETDNGANPVVAGSTTSVATNVTVNGMNAYLYSDASFAVTNVTMTTGMNTLNAVARDVYGRASSNSIVVNRVSSASYVCDSNGNLVSDGTRTFAYDDENQLVSVWATNVWRSDFTYDGLQRRRIKQEFAWTGSAWLQTNEVFYVYDGNLVMQERDLNNLPSTTYTRGTDSSGSLQEAGGIGGLLARSDRLSAVPQILSPDNPHPQYVSSAFYHNDENGNVTSLVEPSGLVAANYEYDPFGNLLTMSGLLASENKYRFSSKEWNDNSGLYYYGRRLYDPSLQRWLNQDPIQELGGLNLYAFISNDSINSVDAFGLCDKQPSVPDFLNPNSPPYDPAPADIWPPKMDPLFPSPESKNPLKDAGSALANGLIDQYGDPLKLWAKDQWQNMSTAEQLGAGASAAAAGFGYYETGRKISFSTPGFKFGPGKVSFNFEIQKDKDVGGGIKYSCPLPFQH